MCYTCVYIYIYTYACIHTYTYAGQRRRSSEGGRDDPRAGGELEL